MITKQTSRPGFTLVTFSLPAAIWADRITLVGDFNDWNETETVLRLSERGWAVTLELAAGASYQYRYLINGTEWHNDWNADGYAPNAYGGDNSVVITPCFLADAGAETLELPAYHLDVAEQSEELLSLARG